MCLIALADVGNLRLCARCESVNKTALTLSADFNQTIEKGQR